MIVEIFLQIKIKKERKKSGKQRLKWTIVVGKNIMIDDQEKQKTETETEKKKKRRGRKKTV